jgi:Kef-type K+ transport system membrane component KefB
MEIFVILFILATVYGVGLVFERIGQPLILGELLAGLVIGPSVLGIVGGEIKENVVRRGLIGEPVFEWSPSLSLLATLGMFFLMFYAGLVTNPKILGRMKRVLLSVGLLGTLAPMVLGTAVVYYFTGDLWQAVFAAIAISGTSLVTKARILDDLGVLHRKIGHVMLGGAMVDNIASFVVLAVVIRAVTSETLSILDVLVIGALVAAFFEIALVFGYKVYPKAGRLFARPGARGFTFALLMGLLIAGIGELIGLHFIIGAYLAGLFVREEFVGEAYHDLNRRFQTLSHGFLGPIFIVSVAFHVSPEVLWTHTPLLLSLIAAAVIGKIVGAGGGGFIAGIRGREALTIGVGMNGRGTVELILAMVGADLMVNGQPLLSDTMISLLVFTAFATTLATPLALKHLLRRPIQCRLLQEESLV